jgi:2-polyprenyl-6-methoxyphenol hydroxylase-like FAD-dependent oxidoreductase
MEVAVVGGGVAGLGAAVALARRGHTVTVFERDDTPMPQSADEAFDWDRRGAPQVRHSHAFLARLVCLLKSDYPDVYQQLLDEGATEMRFGDDLPATMVGFEREPDDDELSMLACRRTTFEWVVRRAALAEGRVEFRTGIAVDGLIAAPSEPGDVPHITGVRLADGTTAACDLVVVAAGRRSALPEWLCDIGCQPIDEAVDDTGIVYFSRFYRLLDGADYPPRTGPIGGDLGYLKYGVFAGDNGTFSVTLATPTGDQELRTKLTDPDVFDSCARQLVATAPWLDGRAEPITPVHAMAGLINRWREYVVGERPVAIGFIPIGDAVLCTNPLYGRGCATAFWGAHLMVNAMDAHLDDAEAMLLAYEVALRAEIYPWYRASVEQDAEARRVATVLLAGEDPDGDPTDQRSFMRGVFRDGLLPALRRDPVVLRAFFRALNLLTAPDAMIKDPDVGARVLTVWQDRDNRPPEPALGPKRRADLLALIAS